MNNMDNLFPKFMKKIADLIEDEEGNIPGNKLLMLGTMIIVLGNMLTLDAFAAHGSHQSHSSHSSHSSSSSHGSSHGSHGSHSNHGNHGSHDSHVSHQSHTSHSNTLSHSNSRYSAEGDVSYSAPFASRVPGIAAPPVAVTKDTFVLPEVNQNIEVPNGTPTSSILPAFGVPATSVGTKIDTGEINSPSATEKIM
ncbi:MAG: His-Xaa-Ser repeat protein HxsA3 [Oscillospiraceae bacterium]